MKTLKMLPAVLLIGACASSSPPAATTTATVPVATTQATVAVDPLGAYEFSTVVDGQTVTGTIHVEGAPGNYNGRIVTSVFPEIPVTAATVEGNVVSLKGSTADGEVTIRMVMDGANFKGNWTLGSDSGEISGKKLPK